MKGFQLGPQQIGQVWICIGDGEGGKDELGDDGDPIQIINITFFDEQWQSIDDHDRDQWVQVS